MRRRALVIVMCLFFASVTSSMSVAAVPKTGALCTKAGATSNASGKKFTCIKSGKKLVWDKGVVVKVPTPTPT
ncbi:MAG: hypothetical protein WCJ16_05595, partial [Actinomycetes bacterium]